jgi:hypothetical protein
MIPSKRIDGSSQIGNIDLGDLQDKKASSRVLELRNKEALMGMSGISVAVVLLRALGFIFLRLILALSSAAVIGIECLYGRILMPRFARG